MNFPPSPPAGIEPQEARHSGSACRHRRCRGAPSATGPAPVRRPAAADARGACFRLLRRSGGFAAVRAAGAWRLRPSSAARIDSSRNEMSLRPRSTDSSSGVMPRMLLPVQVGAAADRVARGADVAAVDRVEQRLGRLHVHGSAVGGRGAAGSTRPLAARAAAAIFAAAGRGAAAARAGGRRCPGSTSTAPARAAARPTAGRRNEELAGIGFACRQV